MNRKLQVWIIGFFMVCYTALAASNVTITTSVGSGADAQVQGDSNKGLNKGGSTSIDLRGNNAWAGAKYTGYLRFDLTSVSGAVSAAKIRLTLKSAISSATSLSFYAVKDDYLGENGEHGNSWPEGSKTFAAPDADEITGQNAPSYDEATGSPSLTNAIHLGDVIIEGLFADAEFEFTSTALIDAINADTDDKLTIIIAATSGWATVFTKENGSKMPSLDYELGEVIPPPVVTDPIKTEADAYVVGVTTPADGSRHLQNTGATSAIELRSNAGWSGARYAGYFRFDLTTISRAVVNSDVTWTIQTNTSTASSCKVYVLKDGYTGGVDEFGELELGEDWLEGGGLWTPALTNEVNGDRAPSFNENEGLVNPANAILVGTIDLTPANAVGTEITFSSEALTQQINLDTNKKLTVILECTTGGFKVQSRNGSPTQCATLNYTLSEPDKTAPSVPTDARIFGMSPTSITLRWSASTDDLKMGGYNVYVDGVKNNTALITDLSYTITSLTTDQEVTVGITAVDDAGNESLPTTIKATPVVDNEAPQVPTGLAAGAATFETVTLSWNAATDNVGVQGYNLYVNGLKYNTESIEELLIVANQLMPSTAYDFEIAAVDLTGNISGKSTVINASTMAFVLTAFYDNDNDYAGPNSAPAIEDLFSFNANINGAHPRILVPGVGLPELKARVLNGSYSNYWSKIVTKATEAANTVPPTLFVKNSEDPWRENGRIFNWMALAYMLDDNVAHKDVYMNGIVKWIDAWYGYERSEKDLVTSHMLMGVACVYDWLFNDLDAVTKMKARYLLIDRSRWLRSPNNAEATMWRESEYTANHNWYNHTAIAMAAVALYGESDAPLQANEQTIWFTAAVRNFWETQRRLTTDGVPVEGYLYTDYGMPAYIDFGLMVEHMGTPTALLNLLDCDALVNMGEVRQKLIIPNNYGFISWSDGYQSQFGGGWLYRLLAARNNNGITQSLATTMETKSSDYNWRGLFFYDPTVAETSTSALSLYMDGKDMNLYAARSGWGSSDNLFAYKCGLAGGKTGTSINNAEATGHCLPDANNVWFWWGDKPVLPGANYLKVKKTAYLNTTLFIDNGTPIEQAGAGGPWFSSTAYANRLGNAYTIEAEHSANYHTYLGESGGLYNTGGPSGYRRRVVYFPSGAIVVADKLSASKTVDFEFRLLLPALTGLALSGNQYTFNAGGTNGTITDYTADASSRAVKDVVIETWDSSSKDRKAVSITKSAVQNQNFGVVLNMGTSNVSITTIADDGITVNDGTQDIFFSWTSDKTTVPTASANVEVWQAYPTALFARWGGGYDEVNVTGYNVYVDGVFYKTTSNRNLTISKLAPATLYSIGVKTVNWAGIESVNMVSTQAYTLDADGNPVTSINNPNELKAISVFPNPAKEEVKVNLAGISGDKITINLVTLNGQIIQSINTTGSTIVPVDIKNLQSGIYLLKIRKDSMIEIRKIIKQ